MAGVALPRAAVRPGWVVRPRLCAWGLLCVRGVRCVRGGPLRREGAVRRAGSRCAARWGAAEWSPPRGLGSAPGERPGRPPGGCRQGRERPVGGAGSTERRPGDPQGDRAERRRTVPGPGFGRQGPKPERRSGPRSRRAAGRAAATARPPLSVALGAPQGSSRHRAAAPSAPAGCFRSPMSRSSAGSTRCATGAVELRNSTSSPSAN